MFAGLSLSVPNFITLPSIGVDISDTSLKYIEISPDSQSDKDNPLVQWGDISIPAGVVERGQVTDPKKLVAVLKECKEKTGAKYIRASLPEERAYLFETEIKRHASVKEIRNLLEFRLAENVPLPAKDVFFDYTILPLETKDQRTIKVAVSAYAKETVQVYYDVFVAAGFMPVAFEIEAQAMARATIPKDTTGATMLVDFGKTRTGIGIIYKDILLYTTTVSIGGDQLSIALRKALGADMSEGELTILKNTQGLLYSKDSSVVHDTLLSTISVIRDELATNMQYWHMRANVDQGRRISQVVLCGGSSNLRGLPSYLSESLGVPVYRGNVWENVMSFDDIIPPVEKRKSYGYSTAIGLALGKLDS